MAEAWTEIADAVFVRRHRSLDLNIGAVVTEGGVLLVDTRAGHRQAEELEASLKAMTRMPVRWVINTHHHWDHTFGNHVFADAAIWGHERCAATLEERGEAMKARLAEQLPDHASEFGDVVITPPEFTFSTEVSMRFGGTEIEMRHLGRAHTDNDIVVILPASGVVFAGDLIEEGAPPSFSDSFPLEWPRALSGLSSVAGATVVPGHGAVVDAAFVDAQRAELDEVASLARDRHADGMSPESAAGAGGPYPTDHLTAAFRRAWDQLAVSS